MIKIIGKNLEITKSMKEYTLDKFKVLDKFQDKIRDLRLTVEVVKKEHIVTAILVYSNKTITVKEKTLNFYETIDNVVDVLDNKISKVHKKNITNKRGRTSLCKELVDNTLIEDTKVSKITKRKQFQLKPMTEDEAILEMESLGHSSFLFINEKFETCLLYKRKDGFYGLIHSVLCE